VVVICVQFIFLIAMATQLFRPKYDGSMVVTDTETKKTFSLEMDTDPDNLDKQKRIVLRVVTNSDG
jgi:hypothetical protein